MTITVQVPLTAEEQAILDSRAAAAGVSVDSLLRQAVVQFIADTKGGGRQISAEELDRAFESIADLVPEGTAPIPGHALSRENLYTREDEWNQKPG